jgi:hypothetical protein
MSHSPLPSLPGFYHIGCIINFARNAPILPPLDLPPSPSPSNCANAFLNYRLVTCAAKRKSNAMANFPPVQIAQHTRQIAPLLK